VYYAVTDHDLSFFAQELGISVEQQPVWEYLPETKPNRLRQLDRLSEFLTNLWAEGKDIAQAKQNDAAAYAGCYASALSRMMKRLGGWKQLLRSLQAEINKHWDPTPSDVNQNIIETLYALMGETPSQQAKALIEAIQTYGWEPIQSHIQQLTAAGQARILAIFGAIVAEDDSWVNQIEQFLIEQLGLSYEALGIPPPITTEQL
jgi:malate/lactate dehydrogenase